MNNCEMQWSLKMKEITKRSENFTLLFIDQHVYEKLNCLMNNWALHSMNNNIIYEKSFSSTKKMRVSRETNNAMIEDQRFYWLIQ
jgi:hypothetical protein